MIVGIGTDLIERMRVLKACEKEAFLKKYFTEREQSFLRQHPSSAANNFAVKEAVSKCFGTGFSGISPNEIEVLRDAAGAPFVTLYGSALQKAEELGIGKIHVSVSDTDLLSAAYAVAEDE